MDTWDPYQQNSAGEKFCDEVKRWSNLKSENGRIVSVQVTQTTLTCLELAGYHRYETKEFPVALPGLLACTCKDGWWLAATVQFVDGVPRWQWWEIRNG